MALVGVLAAVALPSYSNYRERALVADAQSDLADMNYLIEQFRTDNNGQLPNSLADIGLGGLLDPWGNPYHFFNISSASGNGQLRKNKNMVPINSDYDLYSIGRDGDSKGPLTSSASQDDVVRANNGRFLGLASDYE